MDIAPVDLGDLLRERLLDRLPLEHARLAERDERNATTVFLDDPFRG